MVKILMGQISCHSGIGKSMRGSRGEEEMESMRNERLVLLSCACWGERERERMGEGERGGGRERMGGGGRQREGEEMRIRMTIKTRRNLRLLVESESSDGHQAQLWKGNGS